MYIVGICIEVSFWMQNKEGKSLFVWLHMFHLKLRLVATNTFCVQLVSTVLLTLSSTLFVLFLSCVCVQSCFPLLFWLIHLRQSPERRHVIVLLLHVKEKRFQTRMK